MTGLRHGGQDPLAIWNRLTQAQRGALKRMRGGSFLYRVRSGWASRGSNHRVKLETIRALRGKDLVHEQTMRAKNPLFLTPLGKSVVEAGQAKAIAKSQAIERARLARNAEAARKANRRAYQAAKDGCRQCVNGYTISCKTPDTCTDPTRGCVACMTRCTACYETEGEHA